MEPKVSVIIPVYNTEAFLERCLSSVLGQSLRDIEVICVDDGSTDRSPAILDAWAARDERIRVIHQANGRQGKARNAAMNIARGEYIGMVDSDDYLPVEYFERLYSAATEADADIAICGIVKEKKVASRTVIAFAERVVEVDAERKMRLCGCPPHFHSVNKLYRRAMIERVALRYAEQVQFEDVMFVTRALCESGTLVTVPDLAYHYVLNPNSTVKSRQTATKQRQKYEAHRDMVAYVAARSIDIPERYKNLTVKHYSLGGLCLWKIKERGNVRVVRLFDLLPIWRYQRS